jgi:hypothetical protein
MQEGKAPFSDASAQDVVRVYRDSLSYAGLTDSDKKPDEGTAPEEAASQNDGSRPQVSVGDFVQWVSGGAVQFPEPRRVRALSDDGDWAFVDGSQTGIAMSELEVVTAPRPTRRPPPTLPLPEEDATVDHQIGEKDRMKVVWEGSLIHISATVNKAGLERLRKKLDAMETLLEDE